MSSSTPPTHDPKWRRLPEERPRQILEAAIAVFGEHGIAAAKLEEIAARAGVSKGTIYLYFPSKEDLFREVIRQVLVPRIAQVEHELTGGTAIEQIERYLRVHWFYFDRPEAASWLRLVLFELHKFPDLEQFYYDEVIALSNRVLGDVLRRGVASGELRQLDPAASVSLIKAVLLMHVIWMSSPAAKASARAPQHTIDGIVDFVLHALRPDAPAGVAAPVLP